MNKYFESELRIQSKKLAEEPTSKEILVKVLELMLAFDGWNEMIEAIEIVEEYIKSNLLMILLKMQLYYALDDDESAYMVYREHQVLLDEKIEGIAEAMERCRVEGEGVVSMWKNLSN